MKRGLEQGIKHIKELDALKSPLKKEYTQPTEIKLPVLLQYMKNCNNWNNKGQFGESICDLQLYSDITGKNHDYACCMTNSKETQSCYVFPTDCVLDNVIICKSCLEQLNDEYGFINAFKRWIIENYGVYHWENDTCTIELTEMKKTC